MLSNGLGVQISDDLNDYKLLMNTGGIMASRRDLKYCEKSLASPHVPERSVLRFNMSLYNKMPVTERLYHDIHFLIITIFE